MRFLIDESAAEELRALLRPHGIEAIHVRSLDLIGAEDPVVLALARAEFDAVITKDRYRKADPRNAALREMRNGLRIVQLRFTGKAPNSSTGTTPEQFELILDNLDRIEGLIRPDSQLRKIVLNGSTGTVTKVMDIDEVDAEIARLGL